MKTRNTYWSQLLQGFPRVRYFFFSRCIWWMLESPNHWSGNEHIYYHLFNVLSQFKVFSCGSLEKKLNAKEVVCKIQSTPAGLLSGSTILQISYASFFQACQKFWKSIFKLTVGGTKNTFLLIVWLCCFTAECKLLGFSSAVAVFSEGSCFYICTVYSLHVQAQPLQK